MPTANHTGHNGRKLSTTERAAWWRCFEVALADALFRALDPINATHAAADVADQAIQRGRERQPWRRP